MSNTRDPRTPKFKNFSRSDLPRLDLFVSKQSKTFDSRGRPLQVYQWLQTDPEFARRYRAADLPEPEMEEEEEEEVATQSGAFPAGARRSAGGAGGTAQPIILRAGDKVQFEDEDDVWSVPNLLNLKNGKIYMGDTAGNVGVNAVREVHEAVVAEVTGLRERLAAAESQLQAVLPLLPGAIVCKDDRVMVVDPTKEVVNVVDLNMGREQTVYKDAFGRLLSPGTAMYITETGNITTWEGMESDRLQASAAMEVQVTLAPGLEDAGPHMGTILRERRLQAGRDTPGAGQGPMGKHDFSGKRGETNKFPRETFGGHSFVQNQYPATAAHMLFYADMLRAAGLYQVNKTKGADVLYLVLVALMAQAGHLTAFRRWVAHHTGKFLWSQPDFVNPITDSTRWKWLFQGEELPNPLPEPLSERELRGLGRSLWGIIGPGQEEAGGDEGQGADAEMADQQ